ncbi:SpoIIE family protein phosphatase [Geodermatophilus sp. SYSU D00758]
MDPPPAGSPAAPPPELDRLLDDDPAELYENAPCGYFSTTPDGRVVKVNRTLCEWLGRPAATVLGRRFPELLGVGGRVFYETHMAPLLRMQGAVREVAVDVVRADGTPLPCLVNAVEVRDPSGAPVLVRATVFEATSRRRYERALLNAQRVAAESEARSRTVQHVVSELAGATSAREVAEVLVRRSQEAVGATGAALWLAGDRGEPARREGEQGEPRPVPAVELVASAGLPADLLAEMAGAAAGAELVRDGAVHTVRLGAGLRAVWPGLAERLTAAGQESLVLVPVGGDAAHLGVLVLVLGAAGDTELIDLTEPGTRGELPRADEELLATLGRQAAQTLVRVRLHEETARQAARSAFLVESARLLAQAPGVAESAERLADLVVPRLADLCVVDLTTEHGLTRPVARHADPALAGPVAELGQRHLPRRGGGHPTTEALRRGRTVWVREVTDDWLARITTDDRHREIAAALGLSDLLAVPLVSDGRVLGVLTLGTGRSRGPFRAADVEVVEQLALQVAQALDRAQRFELEAGTSHTLQANLLPPAPPPVPGLAVAVRYLAAGRGADVGGDFYDVVPLSEGEVALAVGDVGGHDITAAAVMGQLRSVYRAHLADRPPPGALLHRLQAGWPLLGLQRMATALFALLEPGSGRLRVASAGHPPPVVVTDGDAELLPVQPGRMLGAPATGVAEWSGVLPLGATLLLYTDGLVERRGVDLDAGLALLLAAAARSAGAGADGLCDRVLAELAGGQRQDDVALLAVTRLPG